MKRRKAGYVLYKPLPWGPFQSMPRARARALALLAYDTHRLPKGALLRELFNCRLEGATIEDFLLERAAAMNSATYK